MSLLKKNIFLLLVFIIGFSTIAVGSAEATVSEKYPIRPERYGEWDGVSLHKHPGGTIAVRIWQQGIHSGQQASTKWVLSSWETGKEYTRYAKYDFDGAITFENIPYGSYSLTWHSLTSAKTEGWYYVVMPGGYVTR
ncbi:hypothetical protein V7024_24195 [Bacillus sp. JJ864]|uniref:hypothetical protein n=1 Tax=Bacillus sp. JJ864 TaxID=3122975 RepID=UPI002FFD5D5E